MVPCRRCRRLLDYTELPAGNLDEFVDEVVPVLQGRGLFRKDYEGATLRENLGLERPANSFALDPSLGTEPRIWS